MGGSRDVRACSVVLVHVCRGDGSFELAFQIFLRQRYRYRLSVQINQTRV